VRFASPLQDIRLTDEENDVIKKSASLMNEAYTRKNQQESPGTPNGSLDSPGAGQTVSQPAAIPAVLPVFACCCCTAAYAMIRTKRDRQK
jgi:hypothetical protein